MRSSHRSRLSEGNIYRIFSDIALLMLTMFIFLLVLIMMSSRLANEQYLPKLKAELEEARRQLDVAQREHQRMAENLDAVASMDVEQQMDRVLETAGLSAGMGRRDFDLFVKGLRDLPGQDLHLVVDATGSMHGVATFLIPVLRVIVVRSGKRLSAITWFSDSQAETYFGSMGEMLDQLIKGAPFVGHNETIGNAFRHAAAAAPAPGAYLLIGDEPSDDTIVYFNIPSPVFTMPIGRENPDTNWEYEKLAKETKGKLLYLTFK